MLRTLRARVRWGALATVVAAVVLGMPAGAHAQVSFVNSTSDDDVSAGCYNELNGVTPNPADPQTVCTLRGALHRAADLGGSYIQPEVPGPIFVASPLVVPSTTYIEAGYTSTHKLELVGGALGQGAAFAGLTLNGDQGDVSNMSVHGFTDGVVLGGTGHHYVESMLIGINPDGATVPSAHPNTGDGIRVLAGSTENWIGEIDYPAPTSSSGNQGWGIVLEPGSGPTRVWGNTVGTDRSFGAALPNGKGGILIQSNDNTIGTNRQCSDAMGLDPYICSTLIVSANHGPGIELAPGVTGNTILNARVGTTGDGAAALGNSGDGIVDAGSGTVIGRAVEHGVVISSANGGAGVILKGSGASIAGDRIGVSLSGATAIGNAGPGVLSSGELTLTGSHTITDNIISANGASGIELHQAGATIRGNTIGRAIDKLTALPNAGDGIRALNGPALIGGDGPNANTIASNAGAGIAVVAALPGLVPTGVRARTNAIAANGGLGIDLGGDGITPNDALDADGGPNGLQNAPVLDSVSAADNLSAFHGSLQSAPSSTFAVTLHRQDACDASGRGEGFRQVAGGNVTTNAQGLGYFGFTAPQTFAPGDVITALVTAPDGSTSEFSPCRTTTAGVDLSVRQAVADPPVRANHSFEVKVDITNAGPEVATSVVLTEALPAGTTLAAVPAGCEDPVDGAMRCAIEQLAPGAVAIRRLILKPGNASMITNHLDVGAGQVDLNQADNASDLAIDVAADPHSLSGGPQDGTSLDERGPVFGQSLRLDEVTGAVTATLPDGRVVDLTGFRLIPVGTVVDATDGIAQITAALPDGGTDTGLFRDASFRVRQSAVENGLTEARINTPLDCNGGASERAAPVKRKKAKRRHLWGTAKGRFRIRGRYGSASVRGTKWRVLDTCASTEVFVRQGTVLTEPLANASPDARLLSAGQRILFKPVRR